MAARLVARFLNWPAATALLTTGTALLIAARWSSKGGNR